MLKSKMRRLYAIAWLRIWLICMSTAAVSACQAQMVTPPTSQPSIEAETQMARQEGCRPVKQSRPVPVTAYVPGSGKVCLVQDLIQRNFYDVVEGRGNIGSPRHDGIVKIYPANGVDLDLRGHLVTGAPFNNTTGIRIPFGTSNVRVHNGLVITPGSRGLGVEMSPYAHIPAVGDFYLEDERPTKRIRYDSSTKKYRYEPTDPWNYHPPTYHTLENLKIESGGRGVIMAGSHNVLRNSTIEVDSPTAVVVYGPNAVIEGNTFIVHRKPGEPEGTSAALKLRDAHGAVVRNNRFIVKGFFSGKAEAAINLIESSDVLIENNVAEGVKQWVRKDATSKTVERGNQIK